MQKFEFAPITILTGPNNSGKSTLTNGLKFLEANARENNLHKSKLSFEGFENWDSINNWDSDNAETTIIVKSIELFGEKFDLCSVYAYGRQVKIYVKSGKTTVLRSEMYDEEDDDYFYFLCYKSLIDIEWLKMFCDVAIAAFLNHEKDVKQRECSNKEYTEKGLKQFQGLNHGRILESIEPEPPNCIDDFGRDDLVGKNVFDEFRKLSESELTKDVFESEFLSFIKAPLNELHLSLRESHDTSFGIPLDDFPKIGTSVKDYSYNCINTEKLMELINAEELDDFGGKFGVITEKYGLVLEFFLKEIVKYFNEAAISLGNISYETISKKVNRRIIERSAFFNHSAVLDELNVLHKDSRDYNFVVKHLRNLEIADDIEVVKYDNFAYSINLIINKRKINISELGYGFSQIVKMLIDLFSLLQRSVRYEYGNYVSEPFLMIIEEPEGNLHPGLQSKLANLFVDIVSQYPVQLVIETHSEYLIRKLQYLIAKKTLKSENVIIHYFNSEKDKKSEGEICKEIRINEDGVLTESFGSGFFDEATRLKFDLLKLHKIQGN